MELSIKNNIKKKSTAVVAIIAVAAILLSGTFAYVLTNQHRSDYLSDEDRIYDLTLINNFTSYGTQDWNSNKTVLNPVQVKASANTADETYTNAYVAVQLMEFLDVYNRGDWLTVGEVKAVSTEIGTLFTADDADQALFAIDDTGAYMSYADAVTQYGADYIVKYDREEYVYDEVEEEYNLVNNSYAMFNASQTKTQGTAIYGIHGKPMRDEGDNFMYRTEDSIDAYIEIQREGASPVHNGECRADPIETWEALDPDKTEARDYVSFLLDETNDVMLLSDWLDAYAANPADPALTGAFWIIDDIYERLIANHEECVSGWAYWAQPLEPGQSTSNLLESITLEQEVSKIDYYMHVDMASASFDELDVLKKDKSEGGCWMPEELVAMFKTPQAEKGKPHMASIGDEFSYYFDENGKMFSERYDEFELFIGGPFWNVNSGNSGTAARSDVTSITVVNSIPGDLTGDWEGNAVLHSWDISESGDGAVMAWYTESETEGKYDLYIGGNGGVIAPENSHFLFFYFSAVNAMNISYLDTSDVTNMSLMFSNCRKLGSLDLSGFDTSKVTDMRSMFNHAGIKSININGWDTSSVTNMSLMFYNMPFKTLDLSELETSNVTDMNMMFYACESLESLVGIKNFDTSKVTNMENLFSNCLELKALDISEWDTSKVTTMKQMFESCWKLALLDMSKADFIAANGFRESDVLDVSNIFNDCPKFISGSGIIIVADAAQKAIVEGFGIPAEKIQIAPAP